MVKKIPAVEGFFTINDKKKEQEPWEGIDYQSSSNRVFHVDPFFPAGSPPIVTAATGSTSGPRDLLAS
jgi:hypothetical protein